MDELLIARNPDPDSRLPYLIRVPLGDGMVFRTSGTWPRAKALYCYPVTAEDWPAEPDIVERAPIRSCVRRDRPDPRPRAGEPLPAGLHHRRRPRCGVLAIPAHPQTSPA